MCVRMAEASFSESETSIHPIGLQHQSAYAMACWAVLLSEKPAAQMPVEWVPFLPEKR